MKTYLNIVRKIKVRRTDEAQQLLKAYSDTIQKDRTGSPEYHIAVIALIRVLISSSFVGLLSARSFQIIQQMAESFAKLCLRDNVLV